MRIGDIELTEPKEWDRTTIADGEWLQLNTMKPLWKNEVALAEAIGKNREVMNLFLLDPNDSAAPEVDPPNKEWWICDKDKNVVTKEALIEAHEKGYMLLLNESTNPNNNSRIYLPSKTNISTNNVDVTFESLYGIEDESYIEIRGFKVRADGDGRLRAGEQDQDRIDSGRSKILKVSYETSPYAVDEGKQLAYLKDTKTDEYVKSEDCNTWINVEKRPMFIVADNDYVYYLSSFDNQGTDSQDRIKYRMTFVCLSCGNAPKRRLVRTFLSENINSSYTTTKMRMYYVSDPQGIHWCNPHDEVQDLVTEEWLSKHGVMVDIDQSSIFNDAQKKTARDNIAASDGKISWVKYNQGSQPTVLKSGLSVVTSEQGTRIQNDDASEKFYVAPNFSTPADTGKVFTIDNDGAAKWKPIPTPEKDLTLQMYKDDLLNIGSNTSILKKIYIPEGTTKIEGSFNCYPNDNFESLSIVLLKANGSEYESSANLNFDHLLALDDTTPSASRGQYSNTLNFKFKRNSFNEPFHSLAIKGQSGSDLSNYHVSNIQIMFYKERSDEVSSTNSVTNSENDSENV